MPGPAYRLCENASHFTNVHQQQGKTRFLSHSLLWWIELFFPIQFHMCSRFRLNLDRHTIVELKLKNHKQPIDKNKTQNMQIWMVWRIVCILIEYAQWGASLTRHRFQALQECLHVAFALRLVQVEICPSTFHFVAPIGERFFVLVRLQWVLCVGRWRCRWAAEATVNY